MRNSALLLLCAFILFLNACNPDQPSTSFEPESFLVDAKDIRCEDFKEDDSACSPNSIQALGVWVKRGCLKRVASLLEAGENPNKPYEDSGHLYDPPLFDAAELKDQSKSFCITKKLLEHHASVNTGAHHFGRFKNSTPLQYAVAFQNFATSQLLLNRGAKPEGATGLAIATQKKQFIDLLLAQKPNLNVSGPGVRRPIQYATQSFEMFRKLESLGATVETVYGASQTLYDAFRTHFSTQIFDTNPDLRVLEELWRRRIPMEPSEGLYARPLVQAIRFGSIPTMRFLMAHGASLTTHGLMELALKSGSREKVKLLDDQGVYWDQRQILFSPMMFTEDPLLNQGPNQETLAEIIKLGARIDGYSTDINWVEGVLCSKNDYTVLNAIFDASTFLAKDSQKQNLLNNLEWLLKKGLSLRDIFDGGYRCAGSEIVFKPNRIPILRAVVAQCAPDLLSILVAHGADKNAKGLNLIETAEACTDPLKKNAILKILEN